MNDLKKYIFICVPMINRNLMEFNDMRVSKLWQNCNFLVNNAANKATETDKRNFTILLIQTASLTSYNPEFLYIKQFVNIALHKSLMQCFYGV